MILALALAAVAVLSLAALSLSALRGERKASDTLVGQLVAEEAINKLIYDMQSSTTHAVWGHNSAVLEYGVQPTVSSATEFTLVTYARDVDAPAFAPRRLKRLRIVARWWRSDQAARRTGMGKLEAQAVRLVREP